MKAKISEIFRSLQGEGLYIGVPQVFIRFWGCNMSCGWCDTPASRQTSRYQIFSAAKLRDRVVSLAKRCHSVSLTGGEPLLQADFLSDFLPLIRKKGIKIYLETNGVCVEALSKILKWIDIISMDIKLPSSTGDKPCWEEHAAFLRVAGQKEVFIKAVVSAKTRPADIARMIAVIRKNGRDVPLILQPQSGRAGVDFRDAVKKCLEYQRRCLQYLPDVMVIPQVHKIIKIK